MKHNVCECEAVALFNKFTVFISTSMISVQFYLTSFEVTLLKSCKHTLRYSSISQTKIIWLIPFTLKYSGLKPSIADWNVKQFASFCMVFKVLQVINRGPWRNASKIQSPLAYLCKVIVVTPKWLHLLLKSFWVYFENNRFVFMYLFIYIPIYSPYWCFWTCKFTCKIRGHLMILRSDRFVSF